MKILARHFCALESLFAREVEAALTDSPLPMVQSKARAFVELGEMGLAEYVTHTLGGRFPVMVSGWVLTHAGRAAYGAHCANVEPGDAA